MEIFARKKDGKCMGVVYLLIVLTALSASACASAPVSYIHPKYDFSLVRKIAVLPLDNLTQDQQAGKKVRRSVISEILAAGVVDVIELGQVNRALAQQRIESVSSMSAEDFKKLGTSLGAEAFVVGSVDTFDRVNVGGAFFAEVAITLRAVDAATGTIIWSASHSGGGVGVAGRLFGLGGDTMSEALQKTAQTTVATLFR